MNSCECPSSRWAVWILLAVVAATVACRPVEPEYEDPWSDAEAIQAALGVVRSVLYDEPVPPEEARLARTPGSRVFVCAHRAAISPRCAAGQGENLAASLREAATKLRGAHGPLTPAEANRPIRIGLDGVLETRRDRFSAKVDPAPREATGLSGYWVEHDGEVSWLLPYEVLVRGAYSSSKKYRGVLRRRVRRALLERNPELDGLPESFEFDRIVTAAWVEKEPLGAQARGVVRLYRLHPLDSPPVEEPLLLQRAVWAADYLLSSIDSSGKIRYLYDVFENAESSSYNMLRHGGTTYSLLQAFDRTGFEPYREAAEAAIGFLLRNSESGVRRGPYGGGDVLYVVEEGRQHVKLGGAGLALLMLDQYAETTGDGQRYLESSHGYARFLVSQQKEDGEFFSHPSRDPAGEPRDRTSSYYPGEAILGLARLYAYDRNPLWLETAVRGADWLIDVRDAGKNQRKLANDHWLMIALSYLYQETGDGRYLEHSLRLAAAVGYQFSKNLDTAARYPDFRGGYYSMPRSTPAAVRGEGLVAVLDTCAVAGRECPEVEALLRETVRHELLTQYVPDVMFWVPDPAKAFGGWAGGLFDTEIRNDYVQHNLSAVLGAERVLATGRGEDRPGGPRWSQRRRGGERFPGIDAAELARLRSATMHFRGHTAWEAPAATGSTPAAKR